MEKKFLSFSNTSSKSRFMKTDYLITIRTSSIPGQTFQTLAGLI